MTKLATWDPFRELSRMADEMNRLVAEVFGERPGRESLRGRWMPAVDILESPDAITISVELPGMSPDDVEVTVDNGVLSIRGQRKFREAKEGETYHRVEIAYGEFERSFQLPRSVDTDKIKARFENGVLILELPKKEESKPKAIKVQVK